jgi:hypothetical protein
VPRAPLPPRPRRALVLSNAAKDGGYLDAVRAACREAGVELEVVGAGVGRPNARPEQRLAEADVVFAKGRSAMEAMAVGAAVILCDAQGLAALVTRDALERMRPLNFGRRLLQRPVTVDGLRGEMARYDAADARRVSEWVRGEADLERALDRLLAVYGEAIDLGRASSVDRDEESRAVSAYLQRWAPRFHDYGAAVELKAVRAELRAAYAELQRVATIAAAAGPAAVAAAEASAAERGALRAELEGAVRTSADQIADLREQLAEARSTESELVNVRRELSWITSTATWRWRERLVRWRPLTATYRLLRRFAGRR